MTLLYSDGGGDDGEVAIFKTVFRTTVHGRQVWEIGEKSKDGFEEV